MTYFMIIMDILRAVPTVIAAAKVIIALFSKLKPEDQKEVGSGLKQISKTYCENGCMESLLSSLIDLKSKFTKKA